MLLLNLLLLSPLLHLLLPYLAVLPLRVLFRLRGFLFGYVEVSNLILKLFLLADENVNFLSQAILHGLTLVFLRRFFDRIIFQQPKRVHAQI